MVGVGVGGLHIRTRFEQHLTDKDAAAVVTQSPQFVRLEVLGSATWDIETRQLEQQTSSRLSPPIAAALTQVRLNPSRDFQHNHRRNGKKLNAPKVMR